MRNNKRDSKKINSEILRIFYSEGLSNATTVGILVSTVGALFYHVVPHTKLFVWIIANISILFFRIILVILYNKKIIRRFEKKTNGLLMGLSIYVSALFLASAVVLIFPKDIKLRVFLVLIFGGIIIGAMASYAIKLKTVLLYTILLSVPLLLRLFLEHSRDSLIIGGLSGLFVVTMSINSTKTNKTVKKSLLLKLENIQLIKKLSKEKKQAIKMKRKADAANKSQSIFIANISHEIRTPMNAIVGFSDLLLQTELTNHQAHYLEKIKESSTLLLHIINQILDYSNINSRKFTVVSKKTDIKKIIEEVKSMMDIIAQEKPLTIKVEVDDKIPQFIISDPLRIKQVLINLTNNAIKFTKKGQIFIKCSVNQESKEVIFSVKDSGIGMQEEGIDKLFKRFSRLDSSSGKFQGTGLGLAISKAIVTSLEGQINVKSELGKGSEFYFSIPMNLPRKSGIEKKKDPSTPQKINMNIGRKIDILVAEDNSVNRELIELLLQKKGWSTDSVCDGTEVMEAIQKKKYDLILMDIQMPNMDGTEATKLIRENEENSGKHIPIIAFTAMGHIKQMQDYLSIGMDDFISKPVNTDKLYEKVSKILNKNLQKL